MTSSHKSSFPVLRTAVHHNSLSLQFIPAWFMRIVHPCGSPYRPSEQTNNKLILPAFELIVAQMQEERLQMECSGSPKADTQEQEHDFLQMDHSLNRKISQLSELHELHLRYTYSNASNNSDYSQYEQTSTVEQFEQMFIKDEELYSDVLVQLIEVKKLLNITNDDVCLYLWQYHQWNLEKMVAFFDQDWTNFKNHAKHYEGHLEEAAQAKEEQREEYKGGEEQKEQEHVEDTKEVTKEGGGCSVCLEEVSLFTSGMCEHRYCRNCWTEYIKSELHSGRIFFGCMHEHPCPQAPILPSFVTLIAPELHELYRRKMLMNYSIQNKDICYCPNVKCPYFCSKPSMMELSLVKCPCGQLYCFKCIQEPHSPASCRDVQRWRDFLNSEESNSNWIKNNTRQCPKCHRPIEKKVGCSHMRCICSTSFCYECNQLWDEAHCEMRGECPRRKQLQERQKLSSKVVELDEELAKMMKEADRHEGELRLCQSLVKEDALLNKVIEVRIEVACAWLTLKWTRIMLVMENRPEIDDYFQEQFVKSIRSTMEPVEYIIGNHSNMAVRDLQLYGERVLLQKEGLKKHKNGWLEFYEANSQ